jgi:transcriptional regulator with XRE-family HTH domain
MGRLGNYLRVHRRRSHLTQEELAFLFGYLDQSIIGRLERDERVITLAVARACELIFGVESKEIFSALFENVDKGVVDRMQKLRERLSHGPPVSKTSAKLELLHNALSRVIALANREV